MLPGYKFLKMPASYLITAQSDPDGINAHSVAYATRFFTRDSVDGADILIPAHRPGHWFEVVISPSKASIFIIDHYYRDDNYDDLYAWVLNWYAQLLGRFNMVVPYLFKVLQRDLRPLSMNQTDGNSCGVFQSMNFCYLMQTGKLPSAVDFTNADAPILRSYMQFCILCVLENMHLLQDYANQFINLEGGESNDDKALRLAMIESAAFYANRERNRFKNFSVDDFVRSSADDIIKHLATIDLTEEDDI
jgi:hypothetical protein